MRALAIALLATACQPDLGPAPFTCNGGVCPRGYRCSNALCVLEGEPDPPVQVSLVGGRADPQPAWITGQTFNVFWSQDAESERGSPGLYTAPFGPMGLGPVEQLAQTGGELAFSVLSHRESGELIAALRVNLSGSAKLEVYAQPLSNIGLRVGSRQLFSRQEAGVPDGFGFSEPALAASSARSVMVAYTFGRPPSQIADNVVCTSVDLATGASDSGCTPGPAVTAGGFAVEAHVVAGPRGHLLFWRDLSVHVTGALDGAPVVPRALPVDRLLHPTQLGDSVGVVVRRPSTDGGVPAWVVAIANVSTSELVGRGALLVGDVVPHLVAGRDEFVACGLDADGKLVVRWLSSADLTDTRVAVKVPRVSRAPVASCRLALAGDGTVALAWREPIITGAGGWRVYAALVKPPP